MLSGTHAYFKAQGFESCPECGHWLKRAEGSSDGLSESAVTPAAPQPDDQPIGPDNAR